MRELYKRWMEGRENRLCFRTNNRVVRPFDWGLEWSENWPVTAHAHRNGHSPVQWLQELNRLALDANESFYSYDKVTDYRLDGDLLRFTSPVETPYAENNTVVGHWHPAKNPDGRAVLVLPHWNATFEQHGALCRAFQKLGISALRLSLPYHDHRMPPELHRADYAVSSNLGRTIDATRQAVVDGRACVDWLEQQGYSRLGILGTSLGSCYAFLTSAHEPRLKVNVFNHCSSFFADVVWTGLSTAHIRESLEEVLDLECLRELWACISPVHYLNQFASSPKQSKFIYTTYDTTFLPELSRDIIQRIREAGIHNEVVQLPCGHYTLGESPWKFFAGWHICSFFVTRL